MSAVVFAVGNSVMDGRTGVCTIEEIGPIHNQKQDKQSYYKLRAMFSTTGELIYAPVDGAVSMRALIDSEEAFIYLAQFSQLKPPAFSSRKPADLTAHYREMLASCELKNCLLLLKEIYLKEKRLTAQKKNLGQVDIRYLKIVERLVCEEFAVALQTGPDSIKKLLCLAMSREPIAQ